MARFHALALLAAVACAGSGVSAQGQQQRSDTAGQETGGAQPNVIFADVATVRATVADIDRDQRTMLLRTEDGREVELGVDPSVKNFDQVEKGDQVTAEYHEAVAILAHPPGRPPAEPSGSGAPVAIERSGKAIVTPPGQTPGATATVMTTLPATVEAVDHDRRLLIMRAPGGYFRTLNVSDSMPDFDKIKAGDELMVRHTEAVAIEVTK